MRKYALELSILIMALGYFHACNSRAKDLRVMVIDSGIDSNHPDLKRYISKEGSEKDWHDVIGHGTHIAGIIASSHCPRLKIISCKFTTDELYPPMDSVDCFKRALNSNIDIINFSAGGGYYEKDEEKVIKAASDKGIKIFVAAGNSNKDLGSPCWGYFPACLIHDNLTVVGSLRGLNEKAYSSNYGRVGMVWEIGNEVISTRPGGGYAVMSGTSQATAMHTKRIIQNMCGGQ